MGGEAREGECETAGRFEAKLSTRRDGLPCHVLGETGMWGAGVLRRRICRRIMDAGGQVGWASAATLCLSLCCGADGCIQHVPPLLHSLSRRSAYRSRVLIYERQAHPSRRAIEFRRDTMGGEHAHSDPGHLCLDHHLCASIETLPVEIKLGDVAITSLSP